MNARGNCKRPKPPAGSVAAAPADHIGAVVFGKAECAATLVLGGQSVNGSWAVFAEAVEARHQ
eukprot:4921183-Alexandrium_andersonii.AAC.1